jgi:hypothetical protein
MMWFRIERSRTPIWIRNCLGFCSISGWELFRENRIAKLIISFGPEFSEIYWTVSVSSMSMNIVFYIVSNLYTHVEIEKNKKNSGLKKNVFFRSSFIAVKSTFLHEERTFWKTRCVLLLPFKWWFEWCMMIREKFQNQGGDRFARDVAHFIGCLLLSKLCNTGILVFMTQWYMIIISFSWGIRIYQIRKITVNERGQNLKFS